MFTGLEGRDLNALGVRLMQEHADAVTFDYVNNIGGVRGSLSPSQVTIYHHQVFNEFGLSSGQFGGTLLNTPP